MTQKQLNYLQKKYPTTNEDLLNKTGIIYAIINLINFKIYFGQSNNTFAFRYRGGINYSRHHNDHLKKSIKNSILTPDSTSTRTSSTPIPILETLPLIERILIFLVLFLITHQLHHLYK